jgi:UDP-N-acetyl-D-mannosaminuronic acid transferase (WecB/TagA/CpsF family)
MCCVDTMRKMMSAPWSNQFVRLRSQDFWSGCLNKSSKGPHTNFCKLGGEYTSEQQVEEAFGKKTNGVTFEEIKHGYDVLEELTPLADNELRERAEFWKEFCKRLETRLK